MTTGQGGHWGKIDYLYEDRDIIVVSKPVGLAVIAPEGSRVKTLYDIVTDHMKRKSAREAGGRPPPGP